MILDELEAVIASRKGADPSASYSARLLADPEFASRKVMEEAFEVCLELGRGDVHHENLANEAADLIYHLMCALGGANVPMSAVYSVLEGRRQ